MSRNKTISSVTQNLEGKVTKTERGWHVAGHLDLQGATKIKLPENLTVEGSLYLINTSEVEFSPGLRVLGDLHLFQSGITTLPHDAKVFGKTISNLDVQLEPTPTPAQAFAAAVFGVPVSGTMGGTENSKRAPISRAAALVM